MPNSLQPVDSTPVSTTAITARDVVAIGFRRKRIIASTFPALVVLFLLAGIFVSKYEAEMKILVKHERVDPVLSADDRAQIIPRSGVTEEEINSEVELLQSNDVLRQVVLKEGLHRAPRSWFHPGKDSARDEVAITSAVAALKGGLEIEPLKKSNVIAVRFKSRDPQKASRILKELSEAYMEKHLAVYRPPGQYDFFDQQATQYREKLQQAEAKLAAFPSESGTVMAQAERDIIVQKLGDLQMTLQQARSAIPETRRRILTLEAQMGSTAPRIKTALRTADNPQLMQDLKSKLLDLELKRTVLLQKYDPGYRLVRDTEEQIAAAQAAIRAAEKSPLRDETTDRNPTYEWMGGELAKAKTDLNALQAREAATASAINEYRENARKLNVSSFTQQDLMREAKALEDSYELYVRQREEARITDALDQRKVVNVSIAENPTLPIAPARSLWQFLLLGLFVAGIFGVGAVFAAESMDHTFHTPADVQHYLGVPVIAALPRHDSH